MGLFSNKKKAKEVLTGVWVQKPKGVSNKQFAEMMAPQWLRVVGDCANLVNETSTPNVFFERFHLLIEMLDNLTQLESYVKFTKSPSLDLKNVLDAKEASINNFIDRYTQKISKEIAGLKTEKAKLKRIEDFKNTFSFYQVELTESNKNKCVTAYTDLEKLIP